MGDALSVPFVYSLLIFITLKFMLLSLVAFPLDFY